MSAFRVAAVALLAVSGMRGPALAQSGETPAPPSQSWSFSGPLGTFDLPAAQRGFHVYSENCGNCHSLNLLHYRDLSGIGFSADQIKEFAAAVTIPTGMDPQGNPITGPAKPSNRFRAPFPSEDAARAAMNGALPPDLSLSVNAFPNGANYIYALLTGYADPPAGTKIADGMSYNTAFAGHQIAMPQPLSDGQITYADGTTSTVAQNAHDVVTFLAWAANPEMVERKHIGMRVMLYFLLMAGVTYALKRKVWAKVH